MKSALLLLMICTVLGTAASFDVAQVKSDLVSLDPTQPPRTTKAIANYWQYYRLDCAQSTHWCGTFLSGRDTLCGHLWLPLLAPARATVFVIHGYYDHVGITTNLINRMVAQGYAVAAFDLPGHGLSSGARVSIEDFSRYRDALVCFTGVVTSVAPQPWILTCHSTGGAVALEYLFTSDSSAFAHTILLAPLVRGDLWELSRFGNKLLKPFVKTTVRWFRRSSHDRKFLKWFKSEPLQEHQFPMQWAQAMYAWNDRFIKYAPRPFPVSIIQGDNDETVAWRYNIPCLQKKIPTAAVYMLQGARHQLLNETEPWREQCLTRIESLVQGIIPSAVKH